MGRGPRDSRTHPLATCLYSNYNVTRDGHVNVINGKLFVHVLYSLHSKSIIIRHTYVWSKDEIPAGEVRFRFALHVWQRKIVPRCGLDFFPRICPRSWPALKSIGRVINSRKFLRKNYPQIPLYRLGTCISQINSQAIRPKKFKTS